MESMELKHNVVVVVVVFAVDDVICICGLELKADRNYFVNIDMGR